jgi:hypothetical protein
MERWEGNSALGKAEVPLFALELRLNLLVRNSIMMMSTRATAVSTSAIVAVGGEFEPEDEDEESLSASDI